MVSPGTDPDEGPNNVVDVQMTRTQSWASSPGLFESTNAGKSTRIARRRSGLRFQPVLTGLEDRRLLSLITLASFSGSNGEGPVGGLVLDSQDNLYGTTEFGGASNSGTVFKIANGSKTVTTIASFNGSNGAAPQTSLALDGQGNIYGTTTAGPNPDGTVFEIASGSNIVTTIASFNGTNGAEPVGSLARDSQGNLFGTTLAGGADDDGTVFEVVNGSKTVTTLASFNGNNGQEPGGGLVLDSQDNVFGATELGGASGAGTVFEIASGSNNITSLASFNSGPSGSLVLDAQGNLYGTTVGVEFSGDGTVFEIAKGSKTVTTLVSFNGTDGMGPVGGLARDTKGDIYGTTLYSGTDDRGIVFEIASGSSTVTTLASFNVTNGWQSTGGLVLDSHGNLYGATEFGGASDDGSVFELAHVVPVAATTTVVTSDPNPSEYGQSVAFAATVSPAASSQSTPTGTVTFMDGSTQLGTGKLDGSGSTTFTTSALVIGIHSITAVYGGDSNFGVSTSSPVSQTVQGEPVIAVTTLSFDDADGGVDFGYTINGADLPRATTVALYWSPKSTFDSANIGLYTQTYSTPSATTQSPTPYTMHVGAIGLTTPPPLGTKYLLAVIDPGNQLVGVDETNKVASVASPAAVVNVITHGFNPYKNEATFLTPFETIATELDQLPVSGSALAGQVKSYVDQWDSTTGWAEAVVSAAASLILPFPFNNLALESAELYMNEAASNAEQAAQSIAAFITNPQNGYLMSPVYDQSIDLIGHSRGAAVNARVSQLLTTKYGYTVAQYTSLDGYSTDWPFPSNILGDISITGTATAQRKINFEVEQGLGQVLVQYLEPIVGVLPPAEIAALLLDATSWKAPARPGFDNMTIFGTGSGANAFSNHLNVVDLYSDLNSPYIYESYEGQNVADVSPSNAVASSPGPTNAFEPQLAPASDPGPSPDYGNFTDGSFKTLGMFLDQLNAADLSGGDDVILNYWLGLVDNPAQLLASTWAVTGDAKLVQVGDHAVAELDQTSAPTSIGEYLEFDSQASSIGFDMSMLSASAGDQLQVLFNNNVLGTFNLATLAKQGHYTVPLAGYASQDGEVTFQLVGPTGDTARVQLDDLAVNEANSPVTFDPILPQGVTAGTSFSMPVTANDSVQGQSLTYPLDPRAHSGASIDPISGIVTWNVPASEPAGAYSVLVRATDNNDPPDTAVQSFTIDVSTPAQPASLTGVSAGGTYGGSATLTATVTAGGSPLLGETVTFTLDVGGSVTPVGSATTNGNGVATLTGVSLAGLSGGTYSGAVGASLAGGSSASGNLRVNPAQATLTLGGLTVTYDGAPRTAIVSTDPEGLTGVTVTYMQNHVVVPAPTQPGSYSVTATLNNPNYTATSVTGTLVVSPAPPTIISEKPTFVRKTNKKGKPVGKPILAGFTFEFSDALNLSSATKSVNYQVDTITVKRVKKKTQRVLHPITRFSVSYSAADDSVILTFAGKQTFPTRGQITVVSGPSAGVTGSAGRRRWEEGLYHLEGRS